MAKIKVRYRGIADRRVISKKDLGDLGVDVEQDLVWERRNLFALELESNEKLEEILRAEGHFRIEQVKDDGNSSVEADATDPNKEGDVLRDGNTGATTRAKAKP